MRTKFDQSIDTKPHPESRRGFEGTFGMKIAGTAISMALMLTFTGCSDAASAQIPGNLMEGIAQEESGILSASPKPQETEDNGLPGEDLHSAVIEFVGISVLDDERTENAVREEVSQERDSISMGKVTDTDELYAFLKGLAYSDVTYDNIAEYSITFKDGEQYYVDLAGGIVSHKDTSVKMSEDEITSLVQMMKAARGIVSGKATDPAARLTDFGVRLLRNSFAQNENSNALVSPLSVISALGMTANGAKGGTLAQMENAFGISVPELNAYLASCLQPLPNEEKYKLHMANAIWFRDSGDFSVNQDFLQANADFYGAGLYKASFDQSTLKEINTWVDEHTDGMIPKILEEIKPNDVMYLINALSFDAEWQSVYYDAQVHEGVFTKEDGTTSKAELMYSTENAYLETELADGFMKYYVDEKYAFAALLPKEGVTVSELLASLTGEGLHGILEQPVKIKVHSAIPKYQSEYSVEMNPILREMGMADAFDPFAADLSGIGGYSDGNLFINSVVHKTFIEVGERGTRAGAAAMVAVAAGAALAPEESRTVYLDRPFVYMIVDCESNLPVFIGTVMDV